MNSALIVEDEIDLCKLLSLHLKQLNMEVDYVHTIKDAKEKMMAFTYDLALLDLHLKDGNGLEIISWLNGHKPETKIIVLSGQDMERKHAVDLGIDLFIAKPFNKNTIERVINTLKNQ